MTTKETSGKRITTRIINMLDILPATEGGFFRDALSFVTSAFIIATMFFVTSTITLVAVFIFWATYGHHDLECGNCMDSWWESEMPFFSLFIFPGVVGISLLILEIFDILFAMVLFFATFSESSKMLTIGVVAGLILLPAKIALGLIEVVYWKKLIPLHWAIVGMSILALILFYSLIVLNGWRRALRNPKPLESPEEETIYA